MYQGGSEVLVVNRMEVCIIRLGRHIAYKIMSYGLGLRGKRWYNEQTK